MRGEVKSKGSQFKVRFSGLLFQCVPKRIPRKNRWPISSSTFNNDFAHSVMDMPCRFREGQGSRGDEYSGDDDDDDDSRISLRTEGKEDRASG